MTIVLIVSYIFICIAMGIYGIREVGIKFGFLFSLTWPVLFSYGLIYWIKKDQLAYLPSWML